MKRTILVRRLILLIVLGIAAYYGARYGIDYLDRDRIFASGTIEAVEIEVATKVQGRVDAFMADEGAVVKKGDMIASLEASELTALLDQARASEKTSQIKLENSQRNYKRAKALKKKRMISDQDYDAIRSAYESADSDYNRSSASRKLAEIAYNEATVKAPISGTVLTRVAEEGDLLAPFSTVVTMADLTKLDLMLYVPESRYGRIMLGDDVEIMVDSYPGEKFEGKVVNISNKAEYTPKNIQTKEERTTQVFGIKVKIPNPEDKLKPGMPADAVIFINSR